MRSQGCTNMQSLDSRRHCVRPHNALTCISQVIFTVMVSRTAHLTVAENHSQRLLLTDNVRARLTAGHEHNACRADVGAPRGCCMHCTVVYAVLLLV